MQKDPKNFPPRDVPFFWKININNEHAELDARALIYFCIRNKLRIFFRITENDQALFWVSDEETELKLRKCMHNLKAISTYHTNPFFEQRGTMENDKDKEVRVWVIDEEHGKNTGQDDLTFLRNKLGENLVIDPNLVRGTTFIFTKDPDLVQKLTWHMEVYAPTVPSKMMNANDLPDPD